MTVRGRLMVVDDESRIARLAQVALSADGHDVVLAASGEAALELLAERLFDLVVSDVGLGDGINGWELVERGRVLSPTTRWLLGTGWGATIAPEDARARGVLVVMAKPYRVVALRGLVHDMLSQSPAEPPAAFGRPRSDVSASLPSPLRGWLPE